MALQQKLDPIRKEEGGLTGASYISILLGPSYLKISRLKAKRGLKRKTRTDDTLKSIPVADTTSESRPSKRVRKEVQAYTKPFPTKSQSQSIPSRSNQIISSLFTYNPKIDAPIQQPSNPEPSLPSNAPLDSSTFSGLGLNPLLISHLASKMSIERPTAIQRAALPLLLSISPTTQSRDVFLQSQTGSGKTLSYLLPIIQDLLPLSSLSYIDRSIGTLAVIITPTRELAKQISDVLESLLKMRLRAEDESTTEPDTSIQLTRWLVSGMLIGGATRAHEKARLRKGLPILVSTPGRLLDHLQNTSSFNVGKCRWLVLDEADQLMALGFEESIKGIIQGLDGRRRLAQQAIAEGKGMEVGGWDWDHRRRTILCSATIREDVQKLAGTALIKPFMIKSTEFDKVDKMASGNDASTLTIPTTGTTGTFTPPSQLSQKYVVVPLKMRLVALVALLCTLVAQTQVRKGSKIIVFLSCTDSVDFHWNLLKAPVMSDDVADTQEIDSDEDEVHLKPSATEIHGEQVEAKCSLLPGVSIFRLHGSLQTSSRMAALKGFAGAQTKNKLVQDPTSSILLCTSVVSRGLDLPLVHAVVQFDLPTEGSVNEYLHRVGRTARAGKGGEAWSIVAPSEVAWVKWVEEKMGGKESAEAKTKVSLSGVSVEDVLRSGFGGKKHEYEERATEVQLAFERWVLLQKEVS
jgi:ATP-dependent RNA helicase DDX31/DBP7